MSSFVSGGTGFIGANLVVALNERGERPRVLLRQSSTTAALAGLDYEPVVGDVLDAPEELARAMAGCDWVFHVAAVADYWRQGREKVYRVNVQGTKNVLAAAQLAGVRRFVFTSSLAAMGLPRENELLTEAHYFRERSGALYSYSHSKLLGEQALQRAVAGGLEAVIVNPSVVLGPRDVNQISGSIIVEAARGRLRFVAPGGVNYVDVADVAAGHIAAAERGRVGERYILGGHNVSHREAAETVCAIVGAPRPRIPLPTWALPPLEIGVRAARWALGNRIPLDESHVRILGTNIFADSSKAVRELGLPQTPFVESVRRAAAWYREAGVIS